MARAIPLNYPSRRWDKPSRRDYGIKSAQRLLAHNRISLTGQANANEPIQRNDYCSLRDSAHNADKR